MTIILIQPTEGRDARATTLPTKNGNKRAMSVSPSEVVAWVLVSILTVLFTGLLSVNMIMLWLYKKRQDRDMEGRERKYDMEGNPCYEAMTTAVKQTTHLHRGRGQVKERFINVN